jgi:hypothetical protein
MTIKILRPHFYLSVVGLALQTVHCCAASQISQEKARNTWWLASGQQLINREKHRLKTHAASQEIMQEDD